MAVTDTTEKGLESLIVASLVNDNGYVQGASSDFNREYAMDLPRLFAFLAATQPDVYAKLNLGQDSPTRTKFLHRLQGEIAKRGIVDVLRKGIKHDAFAHITLFYGTPSEGNLKAQEQFAANIFSVTRQVHYSRGETALSLDMVVFINGLPIATFELKNKLSKQTVDDAIQQYKRDRDEKELLFQFGRCAVHFAVDDHEVWMCTHLKGKSSWFLPFNKGHNDGGGNPPNPHGIATDYLWKEILSKPGLADILENYAQVVEEKDRKTGRKRYKQIFPRYHQLDAVRKLLADALQSGAGKRYLIQHSAGSGKSNSIAWLAQQLIGLENDRKAVFDSVIVVTDRVVLDKQIRDSIKQFAQVSSIVGHAESSSDLRFFLKNNKKIIISTVQKFPWILDAIGNEHRTSAFAVLIDEAHSSQGGKATAAMNQALEDKIRDEDEETVEDAINRIMESRKMVTNAAHFAFTATPKNKTLEIFGEAHPQPDGKIKHLPFHSYTMKQAIQEGFILDVLKNYTPVESYYRLSKTVEDDPFFDVNKAQKKLRKYVESHDHAIQVKTEIMVDHFVAQVLGRNKIGGKARAMVITSGIARAIQYYHAFQTYLRECKSPYSVIVAFSGEHQYGGEKVTESSLNGFPSNQIPEQIKQDPYRFLIVADKFQTGYDEPLLHSMYVDKALSGIKAVQTLSRLNRAHPQKYDTFVLDFYNNVELIQKSFESFYRTTILSEKTDPNKLHDLKADLDGYQVYTPEQVDELVSLYVNGAQRERLDPILDVCRDIYRDELDEDSQVDFKSKCKSFGRTYDFLASVLPYTNAEWEKLAIFLNFLVLKLPAPKEEDLSRGILETIDMESYRAEVKAGISIALADEDAVILPVPTSMIGRKAEPELDQLSNIIRSFNDLFGNIEWKDGDKIRKVIAEEIPAKVRADEKYQNAMRYSDKGNARIEHDAALKKIVTELLSDHTELFRQFFDNPSFQKWLGDTIFKATYKAPSEHSLRA